MFKSKIITLIATLLLVSFVSANPLKCKGCVGDTLLEDLKIFDSHRHCWYDKHKDFLPEIKLYSTEAMVDNLQSALEQNNSIVEEKCKADVSLKKCSNKKQDDLFECMLDSLKFLAKEYFKQEQCHGKGFDSEEIRIASVFTRGSNVAWKTMHPDC